MSWRRIGSILLANDRLQALQFLVHFIDLLSILLTCNGFAGIQKAVVDQTGSRPPSSDHDLFLVQVWLWSFFSLPSMSRSSPVVYNPLKKIFLFMYFFACAGSSLLCWLFSRCGKRGLLSACGARASQCGGFFCWGACNGTPLQYSCLENPMDGGAW